MIEITRSPSALLFQPPSPLMWIAGQLCRHFVDKTQRIKSSMSQKSWQPQRDTYIHTQQYTVLPSEPHSSLFRVIVKIVCPFLICPSLPHLANPFRNHSLQNIFSDYGVQRSSSLTLSLPPCTLSKHSQGMRQLGFKSWLC